MKKLSFVIAVVLSLGLSFSAPQTINAQDSSCVTDDGKEGRRIDNGPCLPVVPVTPECNPATESCISDECADPTMSSVECQQQKQAPARTGVDSGFKALAPIPGLTGNSDGSSTSVISSRSLADFFNNLYLYAIGLAAIAAILQITYAGFRIAFNRESISTAIEMKGRIASALFGIVLVLSPVIVFSLINPAILNLELQLPPLDTAYVPIRYGGDVTTKTDNSTGCTVFGKTGLLEIATCPTEASAKEWSADCTGPVSAISTANELGAKSVVACSRYRGFVFINALSSVFVGTINEYRPLAITKDEPTNGVDAIEFANICNRAGRATCTTNTIAPGYIECDPKPKTPVASSGSGKCFREQLICQPATFLASLNTHCDTEPNWTVFH